MFKKTFLAGLALAVLAAQACGSDDGKKRVTSTDAGAGGEAGTPEPNAGGSSAGAPISMAGEPPTEGGSGGTGVVPGGMGGVGGVDTAGAGGEPTLPEPELLFSVKPGAVGLPNTALSGETNVQNVIYTSSTGSQDRTDGTNAVKVQGPALGLAPTDQIVSFALLQAQPKNPVYLFSLADGSEGADPSRTYASYWEDGGDEEANLYYSDGIQSFRELGEGGDQYGYNALSASEVSLGLSEGLRRDSNPDDLTGLSVHDARFPITELYFTVGPTAAGEVDSDVATVAADERGCTVFKSELDGTNSVAFSCADLGLVPTDQIDGLAVFGKAAPSKVVFSVSRNSQGAAGTAVATTLSTNFRVGATLFESAGDGANAVLKADRDLGLGEYVDDEIDGFTVVDAPPPPSVAHAAACDLAYDPLDAAAGGQLSYIGGVSHIGSNVLVVFGQTATQANRLLAYNATTCAFLQQKDMPVGFDYPNGVAIVPLANWKVAAPLDKVDFLRVGEGAQELEVSRYDDTGAFVAAFPITGTNYYDSVSALVPVAAGDSLYLLLNDGRRDRLGVMRRPTATDTALDVTFHNLTMPCADLSDINGVDAAGNLYLARSQPSGKDYRVCVFRPDGELLPLPYWWSSDTAPTDNYARGFIMPRGPHFLLRTGQQPISIERGAYLTP